ncbi:hypothetical protein C0J52_02455 [Blattella germanica]|nr:hypothetical protein C0J52_02455 [Blattella germanica]
MGSRRSKRKRMKPLEYWKGEKLIFKIGADNCREVVGIECGQSEEKYVVNNNTAPKQKKRALKPSKLKQEEPHEERNIKIVKSLRRRIKNRQRSLSEGKEVPTHERQVPEQDLAITVKAQNIPTKEAEREEPFIEWRGRRNRRRQQVIGTMAEETDLKAGQRITWIYVGRVHEQTSTAMLIQHVKRNGIKEEIECEEVETPGRLKAFKLGIPIEALEEGSKTTRLLALWGKLSLNSFTVRPVFSKYCFASTRKSNLENAFHVFQYIFHLRDLLIRNNIYMSYILCISTMKKRRTEFPLSVASKLQKRELITIPYKGKDHEIECFSTLRSDNNLTEVERSDVAVYSGIENHGMEAGYLQISPKGEIIDSASNGSVVFHVLSGLCSATINGKTKTMRKGDIIFVPKVRPVFSKYCFASTHLEYKISNDKFETVLSYTRFDTI